MVPLQPIYMPAPPPPHFAPLPPPPGMAMRSGGMHPPYPPSAAYPPPPHGHGYPPQPPHAHYHHATAVVAGHGHGGPPQQSHEKKKGGGHRETTKNAPPPAPEDDSSSWPLPGQEDSTGNGGGGSEEGSAKSSPSVGSPHTGGQAGMSPMILGQQQQPTSPSAYLLANNNGELSAGARPFVPTFPLPLGAPSTPGKKKEDAPSTATTAQGTPTLRSSLSSSEDLASALPSLSWGTASPGGGPTHKGAVAPASPGGREDSGGSSGLDGSSSGATWSLGGNAGGVASSVAAIWGSSGGLLGGLGTSASAATGTTKSSSSSALAALDGTAGGGVSGAEDSKTPPSLLLGPTVPSGSAGWPSSLLGPGAAAGGGKGGTVDDMFGDVDAAIVQGLMLPTDEDDEGEGDSGRPGGRSFLFGKAMPSFGGLLGGK